MKQKRRGKMWATRPMDKGQAHAQDVTFARGGQAVGLLKRQIAGKNDLGRFRHGGRQDADAARLDTAPDTVRGAGDHPARLDTNHRPVVADKGRAQPDQLQRQR